MNEHQFECSICLDVFTDPVSTPCGHNFCKRCITRHWASQQPCLCPLCNKTFYTRPELQINVGFREVVEHFKETRFRGRDHTPAKLGEVPCDVCLGTKLKALKSCLVCQTSYCETHLEPHQRVTMLKRHKLINPVKNLEDRMCKKHDMMLEFFCERDQMCVCVMCLRIDHKAHNAVPLEEAYGKRKAQLGKMKEEIKRTLQTKSRKVQEIKQSVELSKREAEKEIGESVEVFTALVASIERSHSEVMNVIEEKQRAAEKQAEGFIKELEQEITELQKRSTELEHLSHAEDHHHLLHSFTALSTPLRTKGWSEISLRSHPSGGTVRRAVAQLEEMLRNEMERVISEVRMFDGKVGKETRMVEKRTVTLQTDMRLLEDELKWIRQQWAVDVTLDPETANAYLILSEDLKQVRRGNVKKHLMNSKKRFDCFLGVMGREGFTSGRFYYEVQVKGNMGWTLGVARDSIYRKGWTLGLLSPEYGSWTVGLRGGEHLKAFTAKTPTSLFSRKPEKVGVFVDYEEGEVSFYDAGTRALIHSFTGCTFAENVFPFFSPSGNADGNNPAPLIITPVSRRN